MPVRVTVTSLLPDWWGADEAYADGGAKLVEDLVKEDIFAFFEDADIIVDQFSDFVLPKPTYEEVKAIEEEPSDKR